MKQLKKTLVLVLALLMVCALLFAVACNRQQPDDNEDELGSDENEMTDEEDAPGEEKPEELPFSLKNEDGTSRYTVMRAELSSNDIMRAAVDVRKALITLLGDDNVGIATDWEDDPDPERIAAQYEILIGNTNRPESEQARATLGEYSYTIRVMGRKIVIIGDTDSGTLRAVKLFVSEYLSDLNGVSEMLNVTEEYIPDPQEVILKDSSSGKSNPQIVTTKYLTEDVVVADIIPTEMGYAVDPTGRGDSTKGIQKALDDCARNGGGTVYLPAGTYVVSDVINIPAFVTLRGDWQDPDEGNEYGTVISVWTPSEDTKGPGLFNLGGSGGVLGLTVYYPHQSLDDIKPYGFAFYTNGQGPNYMLATVKNITVINGYRGIGCCVEETNAHEQMTIENFKGTFLDCGAEIYNQADVGTWQDVTISNKYWKQANATMNAVDGKKLDSYTKANAIGLKLGDLEWTEFESLKIDGYKIGIEIVKGKRIQFAGSLYDIALTNCKQGLVVHDLDPRWGMVIARSTIENGIYNETNGLVKLCGVTVTGDKQGNVTIDNSDLSACEVNYKVTYRKPEAILYMDSKLDNTGKTDVAAQLQALLNEAGKTGGVVYLPAGTYRLEQPISVPTGVELRGASSVATRDQAGMSKGTMIRVVYGQGGGENDTAAVTLAAFAGINGVRFQYWDNNGSIRETAYTVRGKGEGVYMVNCGFMAAGRGVDFYGCDNHLIKKLTTFCFINDIRVGGKNGTVLGLLHNCTVMDRHGLPFTYSETEGYASNNDVGRAYNSCIIVDGAENESIINSFAYGVRNLIYAKNSNNTLAVNIGADNIGRKTPQLLLEGGSFTAVNVLRYNGTSCEYSKGTALQLYNRLTINDKTESTLIVK